MIIALIIAISFIASLFRSTFGFGESLIAVPLFLLFLPAEVAVPLSVLISIVIALIVVLQDHHKIHWHSAKWLIIYAALGVPLGLLILVYGNENLVKIGLGLLIMVYSFYSLYGRVDFKLEKDSKPVLFICGFLSGVFGGAYGLNGPPLVVYGNLRRWTATHFRATLQAYFLPVGLLSVAGYFSKDLITRQVGNYFLLSLLAVIPAVFLGRYFNHKLNKASFFYYIYWGLIGIGLMLILNSL